MVLRYVTLSNLVVRYECFEGISCFYLQGRRVSREEKLLGLEGGDWWDTGRTVASKNRKQ